MRRVIFEEKVRVVSFKKGENLKFQRVWGGGGERNVRMLSFKKGENAKFKKLRMLRFQR